VNEDQSVPGGRLIGSPDGRLSADGEVKGRRCTASPPTRGWIPSNGYLKGSLDIDGPLLRFEPQDRASQPWALDQIEMVDLGLEGAGLVNEWIRITSLGPDGRVGTAAWPRRRRRCPGT